MYVLVTHAPLADRQAWPLCCTPPPEGRGRRPQIRRAKRRHRIRGMSSAPRVYPTTTGRARVSPQNRATRHVARLSCGDAPRRSCSSTPLACVVCVAPSARDSHSAFETELLIAPSKMQSAVAAGLDTPAERGEMDSADGSNLTNRRRGSWVRPGLGNATQVALRCRTTAWQPGNGMAGRAECAQQLCSSTSTRNYVSGNASVAPQHATLALRCGTSP
jgi:hypothetical protein